MICVHFRTRYAGITGKVIRKVGRADLTALDNDGLSALHVATVADVGTDVGVALLR